MLFNLSREKFSAICPHLATAYRPRQIEGLTALDCSTSFRYVTVWHAVHACCALISAGYQADFRGAERKHSRQEICSSLLLPTGIVLPRSECA